MPTPYCRQGHPKNLQAASPQGRTYPLGWPIDSIRASIRASVSGHPGKMNLPGHSLMCLYPGIQANWREAYLAQYPGRTHLSQISLLYPGIRKSPGPPRSLPMVPGPWSWSLVPGPWSLVPGPWSWSLVPGPGPMVPGPWSWSVVLVPGPWSLAHGPWFMIPEIHTSHGFFTNRAHMGAMEASGSPSDAEFQSASF